MFIAPTVGHMLYHFLSWLPFPQVVRRLVLLEYDPPMFMHANILRRMLMPRIFRRFLFLSSGCLSHYVVLQFFSYGLRDVSVPTFIRLFVSPSFSSTIIEPRFVYFSFYLFFVTCYVAIYLSSSVVDFLRTFPPLTFIMTFPSSIIIYDTSSNQHFVYLSGICYNKPKQVHCRP